MKAAIKIVDKEKTKNCVTGGLKEILKLTWLFGIKKLSQNYSSSFIATWGVLGYAWDWTCAKVLYLFGLGSRGGLSPSLLSSSLSLMLTLCLAFLAWALANFALSFIRYIALPGFSKMWLGIHLTWEVRVLGQFGQPLVTDRYQSLFVLGAFSPISFIVSVCYDLVEVVWFHGANYSKKEISLR